MSYDVRSMLEDLGITNIKRKTGYFACSCPFKDSHKDGDRHPSFLIKDGAIEDVYFKCLGCGVGGTIKTFLWFISGKNKDLYKNYKERYLGEEDTFRLFRANKRTSKRQTFNYVDWQDLIIEKGFKEVSEVPEAKEYLSRRNISDSVISKLDIKVADKEKYIVFPVILRSKKCVGYTRRAYAGQDIRTKDSKGLEKNKIVLGEHLLSSKPLLVTEGMTGLACLLSNKVGERFDIVATLGATFMESIAKRMSGYSKSVYLHFDNDKDQINAKGEPVNPGQENQKYYKKYFQEKGLFCFSFDWSKTEKEDVDDLGLSDLIFDNFI